MIISFTITRNQFFAYVYILQLILFISTSDWCDLAYKSNKEHSQANDPIYILRLRLHTAINPVLMDEI